MKTDYKNGDEIVLLITRNNSNSGLIGKAYKITGKHSQGVYISIPGNPTHALYDVNPADEYCLNTKEAKIKFYKAKLNVLNDRVNEVARELEYLEKYNSHEEFVADKLDQLFEAAANGKDKSQRVLLMTGVLKTLKESNLL